MAPIDPLPMITTGGHARSTRPPKPAPLGGHRDLLPRRRRRPRRLNLLRAPQDDSDRELRHTTPKHGAGGRISRTKTVAADFTDQDVGGCPSAAKFYTAPAAVLLRRDGPSVMWRDRDRAAYAAEDAEVRRTTVDGPPWHG